MRARVFVVYVYLVAFCVGLAAAAYLPTDVWLGMAWWDVAFRVYPVISACGSLLIAYWILMDEKDIESLFEEIEKLKKR